MMRRMILLLACSYWLAHLPLGAQVLPLAGKINPSDTFPVPGENKNLLFYIQRTHNKNTIMYELNYNRDSTINEVNPVKVYWIRYSDRGETAPLSYIQKNYAYGIESRLIDSAKKVFRVNLVSYKKRPIYIMRSEADKRYHAYIMMNGKLVYFNKAFAKIEGGTFWVPHITYVELTGKETASGKKVTEIIIPK